MSMELLTITDAAEKLGLSRKTLSRIADDTQEGLPQITLQGRRWIPAQALERWLQAKEKAHQEGVKS